MRDMIKTLTIRTLALALVQAGAANASNDPINADPNTGSNFNRYYYANNNPYRFTDPDGRATVYRYADKIIVVQTYKNNGVQSRMTRLTRKQLA